MQVAGPEWVEAIRPQRTKIPEPTVPPTPIDIRSVRVRCRGRGVLWGVGCFRVQGFLEGIVVGR